ncbi:MAG: DUF1573 domain-containing protein [Myxococcales bacterium]|nr:DUF1573 domain-containing protein [Myxococcales bacterium]
MASRHPKTNLLSRAIYAFGMVLGAVLCVIYWSASCVDNAILSFQPVPPAFSGAELAHVERENSLMAKDQIRADAVEVSRSRIANSLRTEDATYVRPRNTVKDDSDPLSDITNYSRFRLKDKVLDFGKVVSGQDLRRTFIIHNDGNDSLLIVRARAFDNDIKITFDRRIPANGEGKIEVVIPAQSLYPGMMLQKIDIHCSDQKTWELTIKANVSGESLGSR